MARVRGHNPLHVELSGVRASSEAHRGSKCRFLRADQAPYKGDEMILGYKMKGLLWEKRWMRMSKDNIRSKVVSALIIGSFNPCFSLRNGISVSPHASRSRP